MNCRSLSSALQSSGGTTRSLARDASRRMFTSSTRCRRHGAVPVFSKTSSPELDSLLSTVRTKIILPAHLSKKQQKLISSTKEMKMLSAEPIIAHIGGEEFQLEHIDKLTDVPNARKAVYQAVSLMKDKNDWDQLPFLLQGLKNAKRKIISESNTLGMLVRKAGNAGRMDVMIECARRVDATGFRLSQPALVAELMRGFQLKAFNSKFGEKETRKALSWAEMVLDMLEDDRHTGGRVVSENDSRTKVEVMGAPLHLAAVRASRHLNGEDKDGKVQKYAEKVLGTSLGTEPPRTGEGLPLTHGEGRIRDINRWLISILPVLHGMKVAQKILGSTSPVAVGLKEIADSLEETVNGLRGFLNEDISDGQPSLFGIRLYNQLLGEVKPQS